MNDIQGKKTQLWGLCSPPGGNCLHLSWKQIYELVGNCTVRAFSEWCMARHAERQPLVQIEMTLGEPVKHCANVT